MNMRFDIVTIFPSFFESPLNTSILKRAKEENLVQFFTHDIRNFANNKHNSVDDTPYGGGAGMVMMAPCVVDTVESIPEFKPRTRIMLTPRGLPLTQKKAEELSKFKQIVVICGRYEGIDQRVSELIVDEEISIGDYVINGGESGALVLIEAITRLVPNVLGNKNSADCESFSNNLLEYPQYTRPERYRELNVPDVLLSGDHEKIKKWRHEKSLEITKNRRPDLLKK